MNPNQSYRDCINSAYFQYQRLYFWTQHKGYDKMKFKAVIQTFKDSLNQIIGTSQTIFKAYVLSPAQLLSNRCQYFMETLDVLVFYLVKCICNVVLTDREVCFSLTEPGWVHIIRTFRSIFQTIGRLRDEFILFDDEYERIESTLSQTYLLVKKVYSDFYRKTVRDWVREIDFIYGIGVQSQTVDRFLSLHLMIGLSFLGAFFNDFRVHFHINRSYIMKKLIHSPNTQFRQQLVFNSLDIVCVQYLNDKNLIRWAQPFQSNIWRNAFANIFTDLDQNTGQQLNIDMNAANTV